MLWELGGLEIQFGQQKLKDINTTILPDLRHSVVQLFPPIEPVVSRHLTTSSASPGSAHCPRQVSYQAWQPET